MIKYLTLNMCVFVFLIQYEREKERKGEREEKGKKEKKIKKKNSICIESKEQHTIVKLVNKMLLDEKKDKICLPFFVVVEISSS